MRLLLIEDNPGDAGLIREYLKERSSVAYQLEWAKSLQQGVELLAAQNPSLILLDLNLPDSAGLNSLRALQAVADGLPVIILTGFDDEETALEAVRRGAHDYLTKADLSEPTLARSIRYALERSNYQAELRASQELARGTLDALSANIAILDGNADILDVNRAWREFGRANGGPGDCVGRNYLEVCDQAQGAGSEGAAAIAAGIRAVLAGNQRLFVQEYPCHSPAGMRWFVVRVTPFGKTRRGRAVVAHTDITVRKVAEAEVAGKELYYRSLLHTLHEDILVIDRERRVTDVNNSLLLTTGQHREEIIGRQCFAVLHGRTEACAPDQGPCLLDEVLHTGRSLRCTQRFAGKDGTERQVDVLLSPLKDTSGTVTHVIKALRDVTQQRSLEEQLQQAQKMEAVGMLAGGVAHDFNNVLMVMMGVSELVSERLEEGSEHRESLKQVIDAGERAARLVRQLLAFSRKQLLEPRVLDLNRVVEDTVKMLQRLIGENILLRRDLTPDPWLVHADPGLLEQVLINLVVNARDAMPKGGTLHLASRNRSVTGRDAALSAALPPGEYVTLLVRDDGSGMDDATVGRIFEPFFTTKQRGKGTGLGLATVYGIVHQSGGDIRVRSAPGAGTTFCIWLPRHVGTAVAAEKTGATKSPLAEGTGTVLVVEDQEPVRRVIARELQRGGYRVLQARDGEEALRLVAESAAAIDLLLTDVVLPLLSGPELAERLRVDRPSLPVLYVSGYPDDVIVEHGVLKPGAHYLQKPFPIATLLDKVREVLHEEPPTALAGAA